MKARFCRRDVAGAAALAVALVLAGGCSYDDVVLGGAYTTGTLTVSRTRGLLVGRQQAAHVQVFDSSAERLPLPGRSVVLEAEPDDALTLVQPDVTDDYGRTSGAITATRAAMVTLRAFVVPDGLDRVPLPPVDLEIVDDVTQTIVLDPYTPPQPLPIASAVAAGQLAGDATRELVLLGPEGDVVVRVGPGSELRASGGGPAAAIAVGDLDGDGEDEVWVARSETSAPYLVERLRRQHTALVVSGSISWTQAARALVAVNLDGTGAPELVLVAPAASAAAAVWLNPTNAAATAWVDLDGGATPAAVASGLVNPDALPDVAVVSPRDELVRVFLGSTDGTLPSVSATTARQGVAVAVGDPGDPSARFVAVATTDDQGGSSLELYRYAPGAGGTTAALTGFATHDLGGIPTALAVGDVSTDGVADVVVATHVPGTGRGRLEVFVRLAAGGAFAPAAAKIELPGQPLNLALGDFTGDGLLDVAVACHGQPAVLLMNR